MHRGHACVGIVNVGHAVNPSVHVPAVKVWEAERLGEALVEGGPVCDLAAFNLDVLGHYDESRRTFELSGAGPSAFKCKQNATSDIHSRPIVRPCLHSLVRDDASWV